MQGPTFIDLAKGTTPSGTAFTIQGVLVHYERNETDFSLSVDAGLQNRGAEGVVLLPPGKLKAFPWSLALECPPHAYAILYGILSAPGDSVLARTPAGLVPLTKVPIAAHLHSKGPLVYGVFPTLPSELVVRRSDGTTLYSESLAAKGTEEAEFCAGYGEG